MISRCGKIFSLALALIAANTYAADNVLRLTQDAYNDLAATAENPLIIDVFATWCSQCPALEPMFNQFAQENKDRYIFGRMDFDECQEVVNKFAIMGLPCIIIVQKGKLVGKITGVPQSSAILKAKIAALFQLSGKKLSELSQEELTDRLQEAMQECDGDMIKKLIDAGVNLNAPFKEGMTPMIFAITYCIRFGDVGIDIVKMLADHGAGNQGVKFPGMNEELFPKDIVQSMINNLKMTLVQYNRILDILDKKAA